jgi:enterochelin esterase-like enzyme
MPIAASKLFNGSDPTFRACDGSTPGECCIPAKGMCKVNAVRQVLVYVPAALVGAALGAAPILCMQDGPGWLREVSFALDNLAPVRLTPFVAISIENGGSDAIKSERGLEYDTLSDRYARFLDSEVLPAVLRSPELRAAFPSLAFATDPSKRGLFGCSSGGAAALTAGWFRPDLFRRVAAYSGTFVDQQDHDAPSAAEFPFGAWGYHSAQRLIETDPRKPLRIFTRKEDHNVVKQSAACKAILWSCRVVCSAWLE